MARGPMFGPWDVSQKQPPCVEVTSRQNQRQRQEPCSSLHEKTSYGDPAAVRRPTLQDVSTVRPPNLRIFRIG